MFHGTLQSIEPALYPVVWSMMIQHAAMIEAIWKQLWLHGLKGLPVLRRRNRPQYLTSCLQRDLVLFQFMFATGLCLQRFSAWILTSLLPHLTKECMWW